jgi:hypothetical protein
MATGEIQHFIHRNTAALPTSYYNQSFSTLPLEIGEWKIRNWLVTVLTAVHEPAPHWKHYSPVGGKVSAVS